MDIRLKPNISHLKVIGYTANALIQKDAKNKFESQTTKCRFLGDIEQKKGYRLLTKQKSIFISKDVVFEAMAFDSVENISEEKDSKSIT